MFQHGQLSPYTYFAAGAISFALSKLLLSLLYSNPPNTSPPVAESPLRKYQQKPVGQLAYPPDSLIAGSRDVPSPYGTIRVYEFGPEDAQRKILFLHGISTPCISLVGIAENLAYKKGCRVMLMDLFGRGWSDGPQDIPYDGRLYISQIFIALGSSPMAWTGRSSGGFELVGYSLGGGLAADFTSWFPDLVQGLVLIAPGGIMRQQNVSWTSRILYSEGWLPERWLQAGVRRRLRVTPIVSATQRASKFKHAGDDGSETTEAAPAAEIPNNATMFTSRGEINMEAAVNWQMDNHPGFIPAFMSSIRHAPIHAQHERWRLIGERLSRQRDALRKLGTGKTGKKDEADVVGEEVMDGKVLIILGGKDKIVKREEVGPDATAVLGEENVNIRIYPDVGHEVGISCCDEIAKDIWNNRAIE